MNRRKQKINNKRWIVCIILFTILCSLFTSPIRAQIGTWRNYLAYSDVQQIQEAGNNLFVLASNDLYQYNKEDQSIYTYDKTNGLSDTYITHIRWNKQAKRLIAVYQNSNIDLIETDGNVINISDLYTKTIIGGKDIHNVTIKDTYAYLACDFGIVKLNVKTAEISESYILGFIVTAVTFEGNNIYAQSKDKGVWMADMSKNLIDPNNWTHTNSYPSFEQDKSDYDENIELVKSLKPGGPDYNLFYESKCINGTLYTTGGAYQAGGVQLNNPGIVQVWDKSKWTVYPMNINEITGWNYEDIDCIDVDPFDANHVFVGGRCGLYEFQNGNLKDYYYKDNSPIKAVNGLPNDYTLIVGVKYDNEGNLWVLNSLATETNILTFSRSGQWTKHTQSNLYFNGENKSLPAMRCAMFDSRNLLWFVNSNFNRPSIICYNLTTDKCLVYDNFINQDGTAYTNCYPFDVKEDVSGNIWIATSNGPFYIKSDEVGKENATLYQEKVPRNDGTNLADYLLAGLQINTIAIDGAGRKWFGTSSNGVFLISEDNMTQLQHFTNENSCLLSNNIQYISIDNQSGEVFFLTEKGLCSYISDATEASTKITKDNVWAYPNPVNPDYTGPITITGLTYNADVKIVSANGLLINQGRSNGGTFTWDGCDKNGEHVGSGIYIVVTATSDGKKGTVCKIAIVR